MNKIIFCDVPISLNIIFILIFIFNHHLNFRHNGANREMLIRILYHFLNTGWNDKIVAQEKTTWFHFRLRKTGFLFFVADHLLVSQLCTNPKSDRSLLSCLKVTQCSTNEIGDAPLYNLCSLPIQVMTTEPLPAPSKCKSGRFNLPREMKTKFPATVMVFGVVSSEGHIIPPWSRLESQHQSVPGCAEECRDSLVQSGDRWQTLGVAAGLVAGPQVQRDPGLASEGVLRLFTLLSMVPLLPQPEPAELLRLVIRREHHQHEFP